MVLFNLILQEMRLPNERKKERILFYNCRRYAIRSYHIKIKKYLYTWLYISDFDAGLAKV